MDWLSTVITEGERVVAGLLTRLRRYGQWRAPALWLESGIITQDQLPTMPAPWSKKSPTRRTMKTMK